MTPKNELTDYAIDLLIRLQFAEFITPASGVIVPFPAAPIIELDISA